MPLIFLIIGLVLLVLDRTIKKNTVLITKEKLTYFIYYFRPHLRRRQFFAVIVLVIVFSMLLDYFIFQNIDMVSHILLLPLLVVIIYGMLFLLAFYDCWLLEKGAIGFNFFMFEREFIQIFSLALFFPIIVLAYVWKTFLLMFLYPSQGMLVFTSFAGLAGSICVILGLIGYLL
jgi:hypothetical protein